MSLSVSQDIHNSTEDYILSHTPLDTSTSRSDLSGHIQGTLRPLTLDHIRSYHSDGILISSLSGQDHFCSWTHATWKPESPLWPVPDVSCSFAVDLTSCCIMFLRLAPYCLLLCAISAQGGWLISQLEAEKCWHLISGASPVVVGSSWRITMPATKALQSAYLVSTAQMSYSRKGACYCVCGGRAKAKLLVHVFLRV